MEPIIISRSEYDRLVGYLRRISSEARSPKRRKNRIENLTDRACLILNKAHRRSS